MAAVPAGPDPGPGAPACQVCGDPVAEATDLACRACGAPHHRDCHAYAGQCSIYGCGERATVPFRPAAGSVLVLEGGAMAPTHPAWTGLSRRLAKASADWPRTVPLALLAPLLPLAVYLVLYPGLDLFANPFPLNLMAAGLLIGLAAPLVAPELHRRPGRALVLALAWHGLRSLLGFSGLQSLGWVLHCLVSVVTIFANAMFGAAVAELLAGPRSLAPTWLQGRPVRFLVSALAISLTNLLIVLAMLEFRMVWYSLPFYLLNGVWISVAAFPVLETSKAAFLERLPAARRGLPS